MRWIGVLIVVLSLGCERNSSQAPVRVETDGELVARLSGLSAFKKPMIAADPSLFRFRRTKPYESASRATWSEGKIDFEDRLVAKSEANDQSCFLRNRIHFYLSAGEPRSVSSALYCYRSKKQSLSISLREEHYKDRAASDVVFEGFDYSSDGLLLIRFSHDDVEKFCEARDGKLWRPFFVAVIDPKKSENPHFCTVISSDKRLKGEQTRNDCASAKHKRLAERYRKECQKFISYEVLNRALFEVHRP